MMPNASRYILNTSRRKTSQIQKMKRKTAKTLLVDRSSMGKPLREIAGKHRHDAYPGGCPYSLLPVQCTGQMSVAYTNIRNKAATLDCAQKKCRLAYADGEGLGDNQIPFRRRRGSIAFLLRTVKGKPCGWLGYSLRLLLPKG